MNRMLINVTREEFYSIENCSSPLVLTRHYDTIMSSVLGKIATWDKEDFVILVSEGDSLRFSNVLTDEDEASAASSFFKTAYTDGCNSELAAGLRGINAYPNAYQFALVMFDEVLALPETNNSINLEHDDDSTMATEAGGLRSALWHVGSSSRVTKVYHVRLVEQRSNRMTCTCPYFTHRGEYCKHILSILKQGSNAQHSAMQVKRYDD